MIPILFSATETTFNAKNGLTLYDTISCTVTEERNGAYTAVAKISAQDMWYGEIQEYKILLLKPNDNDDPQPFRIYRITKEMNGNATLYCEHIKERTADIPVMYNNDNPSMSVRTAFGMLETSAVINSPFGFNSDISTTGVVNINKPTTIRRKLQGEDNSMLQVFGGEFKYDKYMIYLLEERGSDNNVTIEYGKNLKSIKYDSSIANTYSGVFPYWIGRSEADTEEVVEGGVVYASNHASFPYEKILPVDFTEKFKNVPTETQLRNAGANYITENKINEPDITITASFVPLWQAMGYEDLAFLEHVSLCDTVHVIYPPLGITATAKIVKTVYDVLKERYTSVEIGTIKKNLTSSLKNSVYAINKRIDDANRRQAKTGRTLIPANSSHSFSCGASKAYRILVTAGNADAIGEYIAYNGAITVVKNGSYLSVSMNNNNVVTVSSTYTSTVAVYVSEIYY